MCGIVGAIASRNVMPVLLQGLQRLEYRGYDSAGLAVRNEQGDLKRFRALGKVKKLKQLVEQSDVVGSLGIAHTRWATHGAPAKRNAHPHVSGVRVAVVHNGIIENHAALRARLISRVIRLHRKPIRKLLLICWLINWNQALICMLR